MHRVVGGLHLHTYLSMWLYMSAIIVKASSPKSPLLLPNPVLHTWLFGLCIIHLPYQLWQVVTIVWLECACWSFLYSWWCLISTVFKFLFWKVLWFRLCWRNMICGICHFFSTSQWGICFMLGSLFLFCLVFLHLCILLSFYYFPMSTLSSLDRRWSWQGCGLASPWLRIRYPAPHFLISILFSWFTLHINKCIWFITRSWVRHLVYN